MKKNIQKAFFFAIYLLGLIYLMPDIKPLPNLSSGGISDEEGDTWQNPDQKGFYSNMTRSEVLGEVQKNTSIDILGFSIPNYRLNYRPEEAGELVRDQLKSNYLEEIVYPLRSSVFVNGWEPKNSPFYAGKPAKEIPDISLRGVPYDAKITLKPVNSNLVSRLLVWSLIFPATFFAFKSLKLSIKND